MRKLLCGLAIGLIIAILTSCQTAKIGLVAVPSVTSVIETKTVITQAPIATETFILMACLPPGYPGTIHYASEDSYGDDYVAHIPIKDVAGVNYDEIIKILVVQWLEHYKT